MENIRKREDIRLVTDEQKLLKLTSKPTYVSSKIFNENLVAVLKLKVLLTLFDDKRFILDDGITSYAYGHYKINSN